MSSAYRRFSIPHACHAEAYAKADGVPYFKLCKLQMVNRKSNILLLPFFVKRAYGSCGIVAFFFCSLYFEVISLLAVYPPDVLKR